MFTHTIEVSQLDTITKHLIELNQQLVSIKRDTVQSDATKTLLIILTATSPLIVGFVVFVLNKNKEHHQKKSELCGEIYARIVELRAIVVDCSLIKIYTAGYGSMAGVKATEESRLDYRSDADEEFSSLEYLKQFNRKKKELNICIVEYRKVMSGLSKCIGQYRLYLSSNKRNDFDKLARPIEKMKAVEYDFSTFQTVFNIQAEMRNKQQTFRSDLRVKYTVSIKKFQKFIDENSGANLFNET